MRLIFVATGDIALPSFRHLLEHGPRPLALVTQPDKPVGRKQQMMPPAIKTEALAAGIPVMQPKKIGDATEELAALDPEIVVVFAYGQILNDDTLNLASRAIINLHGSLLPKYRGAACIQAAIDAGDSDTGVTALHVVRKLDAGDLILSKSTPIAPDDTAGVLHDRLADIAAEVLAESLQKLANGTAERVPQVDEESSYIGKLERSDGKLDWSMTAEQLERRIRAYDPWPGSFTTVLEGGKEKRLKVFPPTRLSDESLALGAVKVDDGRLWVGTGEGSLELTIVQPDGGKRMASSDYLCGKAPEKFI